ncbi:MAG: carbamoyltransferase HypF [Granulosicoccaceae bacterium]
MSHVASTSTDHHSGIGCEHIRVRGLVQGVGFRPTVWRIARSLGLTGSVINDGKGVRILAQGDKNQREQLVERLLAECPPLARIDSIDRLAIPAAPQTSFEIERSEQEQTRTSLVADAASCQDCIDEALGRSVAEQNRREAYAFGNCTHCGPRFSITYTLPYDRAKTSMSAFAMCEACVAEYQDPANRRFHAQPIACPRCGPQLQFSVNDRVFTERCIERCIDQLKQGSVVAIKSTGGFQLACDAHHAAAISKLRKRKHRPSKPFALMARSVEEVARYCHISKRERQALLDPAAPIVLLSRRAECTLANALAPGLNTLGFMLAHTPLHHLLLDGFGGPVLMTSGNVSGEAQCIDNHQAAERLAPLCDAVLYHDRDIVLRLDDSVMREIDGDLQLMRRARGFAPLSHPLPPGFEHASALLAVGGELKNSFCLLQHGQLIQSQYLGELQNLSVYRDFQQSIKHYCQLYDHRVQTVVSDLHPDYQSSRWAAENARHQVKVQHHHAHIAACLGEHAYPLNGDAVLGMALDGTGLGDDGTLWGCELLLCNYQRSQRVGCLQAAPLPGGDQATRQPWRNLLARLRHLPEQDLQAISCLRDKPTKTLLAMMAKQSNSPLSTSAGRLFDAAAALLGLGQDSLEYEAQAAMALEQLASQARRDTHPGYPLLFNQSTSPAQLEPSTLFDAMLQDLRQGVSPAKIAHRFHLGVANGLLNAALQLRIEHPFKTVALSGGVCQNRVLMEHLTEKLRGAGFKVLQARKVPANDGGLSVGQALVAAAQQLTANRG